MREPWRLVAVFVAAALAGTPGASAHGDVSEGYRVLDLGPYQCGCDVRPYPLFENANATFELMLVANRSYVYPTVQIEVGPTGGATQTLHASKRGVSQVAEGHTWTAAGNHTARFIATDSNGTFEQSTFYEVYPDLPVRFALLYARGPTATSPFSVAVTVWQRSYESPSDALSDVTVHWSRLADAKSTQPVAGETPMERVSAGTWKAMPALPAGGDYELRFSSRSGGFTEDETPPLHAMALSPRGTPTLESSRSAPGSTPLTIALALAAAVAVLGSRRLVPPGG